MLQILLNTHSHGVSDYFYVSHMLASCGINILSRSSLNVIDRHLFGKQKLNFQLLYLSSNFIPFLYSLILLPWFGNDFFLDEFFSLRCVLLALATNLVGLSFSHAFKHKEVRHVVLHTKMPELIIPFLIFLPFIPDWVMEKEVTWKHFIPLAITWLSFIPYFINGQYKKILFDSSALYLFGSLLFQIIISSTFMKSMSSWNDLLTFTVAILFWRCILSLPLAFKEACNFTSILSISVPMISLIAIRGLVSLITQFTFNWAIVEGHPLILWPLLNTTIILSSVMSQFVLKEPIYKSDWIALTGLFLSSCILKIV